MAKNKTKPTEVSVEAHLSAIGSEEQRRDCLALAKLMTQITKAEPRMWGPSIIGFGSYHYRYDSGREGTSCLTGFAVRRNEISVYLVAGSKDQEALLGRLGKHKMGKACLYIRRLSEVDQSVLEQLVAGSVVEIKRRYGQSEGGV